MGQERNRRNVVFDETYKSFVYGAGDRIRTGDVQLGKLASLGRISGTLRDSSPTGLSRCRPVPSEILRQFLRRGGDRCSPVPRAPARGGTHRPCADPHQSAPRASLRYRSTGASSPAPWAAGPSGRLIPRRNPDRAAGNVSSVPCWTAPP